MTSTAPPPTATDHAPVDADLPPEDAPVAPEADTTPASPSTSALAAALAAGTVALYRVRRSGTLRHLAYLAPGTSDRLVAHWYAHRLDDGVTIKGVADEAGVRPLTVRRALWSLDLAEAIDDGDLDDLYVPDTEDESHRLVLQVSDHDYPYGETPLTDPTNVGGHIA